MKKRFFICFILLAIVGLPIMSQDRLVPTSPISDASVDGGDILARYNGLMNEFFLLPQQDNNIKYVYLALPSFSSEYALIGDKNENALILTEAKKNLWAHFYKQLSNNKSIIYSADLVDSYKMAVPDSVMNIIAKLSTSAVNTSSYLYKTFGCDGTTYHFEVMGDAAKCWSPYGGRCEELVTIYDKLCSAVKSNNIDSIVTLMPSCRKLACSFMREYPMDIFQLQRTTMTSSNSKTEELEYYISLESYQVAVSWKGNDEDLLKQQCDSFEAEHGDELIWFSRQMTCEQLLDRRLLFEKEDFDGKCFMDLYKEYLANPNAFLHKYNNVEFWDFDF